MVKTFCSQFALIIPNQQSYLLHICTNISYSTKTLFKVILNIENSAIPLIFKEICNPQICPFFYISAYFSYQERLKNTFLKYFAEYRKYDLWQ